MDLARARWLASDEGTAALESLPAELAGMPLARRVDILRRSYPPGHASALSEQLDLRARALDRFGGLPFPLYSAPGLEMMTHPLVSQRRAARLASTGVPVVDLTCGIGGDLSALASFGPAAGMDSDPVAVTLARRNVPGALVVIGDATHAPFDPGRAAVLLDPARRSGYTRRFDPAAFSPAWDSCIALARSAVAGVLKGPPGLLASAIPPDAEVEYVQLGRSMREAALYFGASGTPGLRRAVILPAGVCLDGTAPEGLAHPAPVGDVIYDPASAITLAGLVRHLARQLDARLIDPRLGYMTAGEVQATPLADAFRVLDVVPFSIARLRSRLRELGLRPDEIRRRAFPIEPDELRSLLGRIEGEPATLLCCTVAGRRTVIIARREQP